MSSHFGLDSRLNSDRDRIQESAYDADFFLFFSTFSVFDLPRAVTTNDNSIASVSYFIDRAQVH